jgi:basic membrane lipoprotein Med (substrate-binding protein (PBP1-ABC) superfamily)
MKKGIGVCVLLIAAVGVAAVAVGVSGGATKKQFKVAILDPGTENDASWGQAWADGAKRAAKQYGVKLTVVGNVFTTDQYVSQGSAFAQKGYDMVVMPNGVLYDTSQKLAKQFPNTYWIMSPLDFLNRKTAAKKFQPNMGVVDIEQQDGAFRAGVLAGLITKTNKIASVNAFAFPALTRQPEAFSLGARCVNSKIEFEQKYINTYTDTAVAKAATQAFIGDGADVILGPTNQAVQGIFAAAEGAPRPTYIIPEYYDAHKQAPSVVLTTVLFNLQGVSYDLVKRLVTHHLPPRFFYSYTFTNFGSGTLSPFYNLAGKVPASARKTLAAIDAKIKSGQIRIPDETSGINGTGKDAIGKPNTAVKINVRSLGCKPAA